MNNEPSTSTDKAMEPSFAGVNQAMVSGPDAAMSAANLPAPLADPLRGLRTGLIWLNRCITLIIVAATGWELMSGNYFVALVLVCAGLLGNLWMRGVTGLLPDRATDILYLRSFRTDIDTADIRTALERVLGDQHRVSGIRDPQRRWPAILRFMSYLVFVFKYSHPKYMNLEAGDEWQGRLWRSLGEARGVVIDVADLTPAVEAEIRLCVQCVGLQRILFVTRDSLNSKVWRRLLELADCADREGDLQTAIWRLDDSTLAFEREVLAFANQLPSTSAGFKPEVRALAEQLPDQHFRESNILLVFEIAIGLVLGTAFVAGFNMLRELGTWEPALWVVLYFGWAFVLGRQYAEFRQFCGSEHRLRLARRVILPIRLGAVVALLAVFVGLLLPDVKKVREAAMRLKSSNNLKQIGEAMHFHNAVLHRLPAANASNPNTPWMQHQVSWRVMLLPYLERQDLYQRYRFDEPWDGPNNRELIPLMPDVYRLPTFNPKEAPEGHTFYRVFGSRPGEETIAAFIDGEPGLSLSKFTDGTEQTLLVVEASESVPWTQPECLEFNSEAKMLQLGKHYLDSFHGVTADVSTFLCPADQSEVTIRAYVTANGGELINDK